MKIQDYITSIFIVSGIFLGMYALLISMAAPDAHNIVVDTKYQSSYDKVQETYEGIQEIKNETQAIYNKDDSNFFSGLWDGFKVVKVTIFGTGKTAFKSIDVGFGLLQSFVSDLGLDNTYIMYILLGIITIAVVFALLEILTKVRS